MPTIAETAIDQQVANVLVDHASGCAFVAVVTIGPCILGYPLRVLGGSDVFLVWAEKARLVEIFLSDPFYQKREAT